MAFKHLELRRIGINYRYRPRANSRSSGIYRVPVHLKFKSRVPTWLASAGAVYLWWRWDWSRFIRGPCRSEYFGMLNKQTGCVSLRSLPAMFSACRISRGLGLDCMRKNIIGIKGRKKAEAAVRLSSANMADTRRQPVALRCCKISTFTCRASVLREKTF